MAHIVLERFGVKQRNVFVCDNESDKDTITNVQFGDGAVVLNGGTYFFDSNGEWQPSDYVLGGGGSGSGGALRILGAYDTLSALKAAHPTGTAGDAYLIGTHIYVWTDSAADYTDGGAVVGPAGTPGQKGNPGSVGPQGPVGPQGVQGERGETGFSNISFAGRWTSGQEYVKDDGVFHNDKMWVCIMETTEEEPTDASTDWSPAVFQGPAGVQGPMGPAGAKGDAGLTVSVNKIGPVDGDVILTAADIIYMSTTTIKQSLDNKANVSETLRTTGTQTAAGLKIFSDGIAVGAAITGNKLTTTNKSILDTTTDTLSIGNTTIKTRLVGSAIEIQRGGTAYTVLDSGNIGTLAVTIGNSTQSIAGFKSFVNPVVLAAAPESDTHAVNRGWVYGELAGKLNVLNPFDTIARKTGATVEGQFAVFEKWVQFDVLPENANTWTLVGHGISQLQEVISISGMLIPRVPGGETYPIPSVNPDFNVSLKIDTNNIGLSMSNTGGVANFDGAWVKIQYIIALPE